MIKSGYNDTSKSKSWKVLETVLSHLKHGSHADSTTYLETSKKKGTFFEGSIEDRLGDNIFACTKDGNRPGMSVEDRKFINIIVH